MVMRAHPRIPVHADVIAPDASQSDHCVDDEVGRRHARICARSFDASIVRSTVIDSPALNEMARRERIVV